MLFLVRVCACFCAFAVNIGSYMTTTWATGPSCKVLPLIGFSDGNLMQSGSEGDSCLDHVLGASCVVIAANLTHFLLTLSQLQNQDNIKQAPVISLCGSKSFEFGQIENFVTVMQMVPINVGHGVGALMGRSCMGRILMANPKEGSTAHCGVHMIS